jgi:hypothetical protein
MAGKAIDILMVLVARIYYFEMLNSSRARLVALAYIGLECDGLKRDNL